PAHRSIDDADIGEAARLQRVDDRACRATCSQNRCGCHLRPAGSPLVEVGGKTVAVSVAAAELTILEPERVRRADNLGRFILLLKQGKSGFLMRDCDVAAGNALPANIFDEGGKLT